MAVQQRAEIHSASEGKKRKDECVWLWWVNCQNVPKICDREHREHKFDRNTESLIRFYLL